MTTATEPTAADPQPKTPDTVRPETPKAAKTKGKVHKKKNPTSRVVLNAENAAAMQNDVRMLLIAGTIPRMVTQAMTAKYGVSTHDVEKLLEIAHRDMVRSSGYYKEQIKDVCHRTLMTVLQDGRARTAEKLSAVRQCSDLFGLQLEPEDEEESHQEAYLEARRRLDRMDIQEMEELKKASETGAADPNGLFSPLAVPKTTKRPKR